MHKEVFEYVEAALRHFDVAGSCVIEVGSYDFNGTVRPIFTAQGPAEYIGVDVLEGPGVDVVCDAGELVDRFGENRFDIVVTTEMMEHMRNWRAAIRHMKRVLRPGGHLVLTTRSHGTSYHGYPYDFWRYEISDIEAIFKDFMIIELVNDPSRPGVFMTVHKPETFTECDLEEVALHSILVSRRTKHVPLVVETLALAGIGLRLKGYEWMVKLRMAIWALLPIGLRKFLKRHIFDKGKSL